MHCCRIHGECAGGFQGKVPAQRERGGEFTQRYADLAAPVPKRVDGNADFRSFDICRVETFGGSGALGGVDGMTFAQAQSARRHEPWYGSRGVGFGRFSLRDFVGGLCGDVADVGTVDCQRIERNGALAEVDAAVEEGGSRQGALKRCNRALHAHTVVYAEKFHLPQGDGPEGRLRFFFRVCNGVRAHIEQNAAVAARKKPDVNLFAQQMNRGVAQRCLPQGGTHVHRRIGCADVHTGLSERQAFHIHASGQQRYECYLAARRCGVDGHSRGAHRHGVDAQPQGEAQPCALHFDVGCASGIDLVEGRMDGEILHGWEVDEKYRKRYQGHHGYNGPFEYQQRVFQYLLH